MKPKQFDCALVTRLADVLRDLSSTHAELVVRHWASELCREMGAVHTNAVEILDELNQILEMPYAQLTFPEKVFRQFAQRSLAVA
jgi:hypothetical protein